MDFSGLSFFVSFSCTRSLHFCTPLTMTFVFILTLLPVTLLFVNVFNFTVLYFFPLSNFLYNLPFPPPYCFLHHLYFKFNLFIILFTVYLTLFHFRLYRVIHKSLRNFLTRLRNNQERKGRKEHINR